MGQTEARPTGTHIQTPGQAGNPTRQRLQPLNGNPRIVATTRPGANGLPADPVQTPKDPIMAHNDPELDSIAASIAANAAIARLDTAGRAARTAPARDARWQKYLDQVDPDRLMSEADRERAAQHALTADMRRLSLLAAKARKKKPELEPALSSS